MKTTCFIATLLLLVSCNGGGGGKSPEVSPPAKITQSFSDSTVTNFVQTGGVAMYDKYWYEYFIETAYAGGGDVSCITGQSVEVSMDITLGGVTSPLDVDATCGSDIDLKIRQGMLAALDGHKMMREFSGADTGPLYILDFTAGFAFGQPFTVLEKKGWSSLSPADQLYQGNWCYLDYTFNEATGSVSNNTIDTGNPSNAYQINIAVNASNSISNPNMPSTANGYAGCATSNIDYGSSQFRFKDGKIEFDESNTGNFSINGCAKWDEVTGDMLDYKNNGDGTGNCPDADYDSTFERWCIDDDTDGVCDT